MLKCKMFILSLYSAHPRCKVTQLLTNPYRMFAVYHAHNKFLLWLINRPNGFTIIILLLM